MPTLSYPARIQEPEPGAFVVAFADIPEAITGGATYDEALAEAPDALAVALQGYLSRGRRAPAPRPAGPGEVDVVLEPAVAARVLLQRAMAEQALSNVALAARMNRQETAVRRILAGKGASLELTLEALKAVGVRPGLAAPG